MLQITSQEFIQCFGAQNIFLKIIVFHYVLCVNSESWHPVETIGFLNIYDLKLFIKWFHVVYTFYHDHVQFWQHKIFYYTKFIKYLQYKSFIISIKHCESNEKEFKYI